MTGVGSRLGHRSRVVKLGTELVYHGILCLLVQDSQLRTATISCLVCAEHSTHAGYITCQSSEGG